MNNMQSEDETWEKPLLRRDVLSRPMAALLREEPVGDAKTRRGRDAVA